MVDFAALLKASQEKKNEGNQQPVVASGAQEAQGTDSTAGAGQSQTAREESTPADDHSTGTVSEVSTGVRESVAGNPRNPFAAKAEPAEPVREITDSEPEVLPPVTTAPKLAGLKFATSAPVDKSPANTKPVTQLESLDDMDNLDLCGIEAIGDDDAPRSQFADETPATAPTRELPADLDKQAKAFIDLIDGVYGMLHDPEFLGQVIRNIMIELKENPQYVKHICDDDVRVWIRTMRESMGLARVKKLESKTKRGSGTGTRASKSKVDDDMMSDLASLGLDL